ncbi:hypothetical protein [Salinarimonas soli]|uniref:Uncharacterized protein n=1 Tax=Salinarimonas soli TaxID=1638099 RepID=A0A5B2W0V9_9HYPH|nr:hypothetical protein [Salinarimonas soli]KAA2244272.1 hypothetical protein F0L46_01100 [Salinarimonas soli]
MMSIGTLSSSSIALSLIQSASATAASQTAPAGAAPAKPAGSPGVGLSGNSQSLLARNSEAMATIMRLVEQGTAAKSEAPQKAVLQEGDLPSSARWAAHANADNLGLLKASLGNSGKWIAFARELRSGQTVQLTPGRIPSDDESFQNSVRLDIARRIVDFEASGQTEKAKALRSAMDNGTIRFQKSSEVPDLNLRYEITHFADAGGGGTKSSWNWNPVGAVKAALDSGDAFAFGAVDRGAFYVSW